MIFYIIGILWFRRNCLPVVVLYGLIPIKVNHNYLYNEIKTSNIVWLQLWFRKLLYFDLFFKVDTCTWVLYPSTSNAYQWCIPQSYRSRDTLTYFSWTLVWKRMTLTYLQGLRSKNKNSIVIAITRYVQGTVIMNICIGVTIAAWKAAHLFVSCSKWCNLSFLQFFFVIDYHYIFDPWSRRYI